MEKLNLGLQLYTLREYCATPKLFHHAVDKAAEMGYKYIQFSGGAATEQDFIDALKRTGLICGLTHAEDDELINHTQDVIEFHNKLGCDNIGIGGLPYAYRNHDGFYKFIERYGKAMEELKKAGKNFCYHNHWFEFEKYEDGKTGMDILLENTDPDVFKLTLDTAWAHRAGIDCADFIRRHPGRVACLHLKDYMMVGDEVTLIEVLDGNMNFDSIIDACIEDGIKWLFVEQDFIRMNAYDSAQRSYDNLMNKYGDVLQ